VSEMLTTDGLDAALRRIGAERYHNLHPFHRLLHGGKLNKGQVQAWALNRYCYQSALTDGLGLDRGYVVSMEGALPATRFAVEAYVRFVAERSLLEAVASSLTEMFSPNIISERVAGMLAGYDFISRETLAYFNARLTQAPRDADFALDYVKREARTPEQQRAVMAALEFKCGVLWAQLDGLYLAYVEPGFIPPGAFVPERDAASARAGR
jgi:coenzyme PQQ biosynthesis protein C